jgi:FG-GAP repeat
MQAGPISVLVAGLLTASPVGGPGPAPQAPETRAAPTRPADWTAESDQAGALFGSVRSAGDVNADGYDDVIVGAPRYQNGQFYEGRAFVYLGSAGGLSSTASWTAESDQIGAYFGESVSGAGDVNGDGYGDAIVGAPYFDDGQTDQGRAFLYLGSASGLNPLPDWTAEPDQAEASFGSVRSAGDVNADGYDDVIVGAPGYTHGQAGEGRAFVYLGSPSGLSPTPDWTAEPDQSGAYFGLSVDTAGDVNADGYDDVIVGALHYHHGQTDEGRAFVYFGSAAGLGLTPGWIAESDQAGAYFGFSVGGAGDVNGDGYGDAMVGAPDYDHGQTDEGRAFVYQGSAAGLSPTPDWTAESNQPGSFFGGSVAATGDVNGDGYGDAIVGADEYNDGQTDEGRTYAYTGSAFGLGSRPEITESNQANATYGGSLGTAGDVNADGFADVIVGAGHYDHGQTDEGVAFATYGPPA